MDLGELFYYVKDIIKKEDLIPYENVNNEDIKKSIELCSKLTQIDISNFYYSKKGLSDIYYYFNYNLVEVHASSEWYLKEYKIKNRIERTQHYIDDIIKKKDFRHLFISLIDSRISFWVYEELFNEIPDKDRYPIFKNIYVSSEYGFMYLNKNFIRKIFKYAPKKNISKIQHLVDNKGYITIYRGQNSLSSNVSKAYSWSININTAMFFATRFNYNGDIYIGKVHIDNIIDYIDDRDEYEIIVYPKDIQNISKLNM